MTTLTEVTHDLTARDEAIRIGVLSDTHGEISPHIIDRLSGCDVILHAGDVCGQHVLDELATITSQVIAVGGNNDPRFSYSDDRLSDVAHVHTRSGAISVLHGHQFGVYSPSHARMRDAFASSRVIVYGHSHKQIHDTDAVPDVLNPGAAGHTRTNGGSSCAVLTASSESDWSIELFRAS